MRVPNCENGQVSQSKLDEYLLSKTHSVGKTKAKFFYQIGFRKENSEALRKELLQLLRNNDYREAISTDFGIKYVIEGILKAPHLEVRIRAIWIIEKNEENPRFVTAYPTKN